VPGWGAVNAGAGDGECLGGGVNAGMGTMSAWVGGAANVEAAMAEAVWEAGSGAARQVTSVTAGPAVDQAMSLLAVLVSATSMSLLVVWSP
jgi:ABC-type enterobactin transport system permease subunit